MLNHNLTGLKGLSKIEEDHINLTMDVKNAFPLMNDRN